MFTIFVIIIANLTLYVSHSSADRYHPEWRDNLHGEGAQPSPAESSASYWRTEAASALRQRLVERERRGRAKNVVLFLGDGMSVPTLMAARTLLGQRDHRPGEESRLSFETFPTVGLAKARTSARCCYKYYHSIHETYLFFHVNRRTA